ncbi:hemagglutinin/amebocyte aggregation factor [Elysia marginata]|uniref:Hemagglutinin/amebocyte aggregation factor n=1 Tax=Elysia marginata TaxID=1093978 RepID=A0AAV4JUW5_9GAST|nr:hemagglutinin/amebocyte aggregation factor [Elysia marginata]
MLPIAKTCFGLLFFLGFLGLCQAQTWLHSYRRYLNYTCPPGEVFSRLESEHHDSKDVQDRKWHAECATPDAGAATNCAWSGLGYVNDYDGIMLYQCPDNSVLSGMASVYSKYYLDRRYKFYCCGVSDTVAHSCYYTGYQNDFNNMMDFKVPTGWIIKGVFSHHSNHVHE